MIHVNKIWPLVLLFVCLKTSTNRILVWFEKTQPNEMLQWIRCQKLYTIFDVLYMYGKRMEAIDSDGVRLQNKFTFVSLSRFHILSAHCSWIVGCCSVFQETSIDSCRQFVFLTHFNKCVSVCVCVRGNKREIDVFSILVGHLNKVRKVNIGFIMFTERTVFVRVPSREWDCLTMSKWEKVRARNRRSTTTTDIYSDIGKCIFTWHSIHFVRHSRQAQAKINLSFVLFLLICFFLLASPDKCMCLVFVLGRCLSVLQEGNSSIARKMLAIPLPYDNINENDFHSFVRFLLIFPF